MNAITVQAGSNGAITPAQEMNAFVLGRFLAYLDTTPKTIETYSRALKQLFSFFASKGIRRPQREDIIAFRDELKESGHKPTTIQNYITAAKIFFSWAAQEGIYTNIAEHLKGAKLDREHKKDPLTAYQVKEILDSIDRNTKTGRRDYALFSLMVTGGLRDIEVSRATIGDIRTAGEYTVLYVQGKGRTEKTEYIKLCPEVEAAIRDHLKDRETAGAEEPLFISTSNNSKGKTLSTRSISGIIKSIMKGAGYNSERLTAHSLRHTAVTLSLLAGNDLTEVQQFARHANLNTTMIYNHALDKAKNACSQSIAAMIF